MNRSVSSWLSPNSSDRRPAEMCRQTSICHIRSLGVDVALREEQVVGRVGGDMGDPGHIANDADRRDEAVHSRRPALLGDGPRGDLCQQADGGDDERENRDQREDPDSLDEAHAPSRSPDRRANRRSLPGDPRSRWLPVRTACRGVSAGSAVEQCPQAECLGTPDDRGTEDHVGQTDPEVGDHDPTLRRPRRSGQQRLAERGRRVRVVLEQARRTIGQELFALVDQEEGGRPRDLG